MLSSSSLSLLIVAQAAVVSMFPVIVADAPDLNASSPSLVSSARPAASLMSAFGFMYLKKAIVRNISGSLSLSSPSSGVPGIGMSAFIGIESTPTSERLTAMSSLSSHVSPIPIIPPEHAYIPSAFTFLSVSIFIS